MEIILGLALLAFSIYCAWVLVEKTGYPGWVSLLFLIPGVNIVLWIYFAFTDWPIEEELKRYQALYGKLDPKPEDDMREDFKCIQCGATIPAQIAVCSSCGWTYKTVTDAEPKPAE